MILILYTHNVLVTSYSSVQLCPDTHEGLSLGALWMEGSAGIPKHR